MSRPLMPSQFSRRRALLAAGAAAAVVPLAGCEKLISEATRRMGTDVPETLSVPTGPDTDAAHHLLCRAAYGPWPGDLDEVRTLGQSTWIERQLAPDDIDDSACDLRARVFEELLDAPGECYEFKREVLRADLSRHTLLRAVYSRRQLYEVMVGFWTDHLNINIEKGDCIYLKPWDDQEVVRKHALGKFRDLIRASATSPAMLVYLDGNQNTFAKAGDIPNENYGRELLELHTLGVHGGYTQTDVYEAARALTGWRVGKGFYRGSVFFEPKLHDDTAKAVLGVSLPAGGGEADIDRLVDIVCRHPATARHIALKLCQKFVAEDPPAPLVERVAAVFTQTDGDIKSLVRTILTSAEFAAAKGVKFKRPFQFIASSLRAVAADTHAHAPLIEYLVRMGQGIFQYPTPDGYPDKADPWLGTLLWRWNFAFALASGSVPTVVSPLDKLTKAIAGGGDARGAYFRYLTGRDGTAEEMEAIREAVPGNGTSASERADLIALVLASPAFQMC
ncbi:DUF1800 domain-containing protein [Humisphaera borealis]|uniref:DUF1800 domain-containing protein n=1 Tax=Humisphaera borealis TaxID=2807512 RepID=A0A7M2WTL6_9BACT|nr:DUF1800 domain-containing protein [Humisphaera borealis]QOV88161.1 DUF1800 domain-containing protein [Humisphaera borealis]